MKRSDERTPVTVGPHRGHSSVSVKRSHTRCADAGNLRATRTRRGLRPTPALLAAVSALTAAAPLERFQSHIAQCRGVCRLQNDRWGAPRL